MSLTEKELKQEIHRLAPFHHKVELPYGLTTYVPECLVDLKNIPVLATW